MDYESVSRTMYKEEKKRNECERLFCEAEFVCSFKLIFNQFSIFHPII